MQSPSFAMWWPRRSPERLALRTEKRGSRSVPRSEARAPYRGARFALRSEGRGARSCLEGEALSRANERRLSTNEEVRCAWFWHRLVRLGPCDPLGGGTL